MRFLTTFFIALIVSTSAYARPMGGAQSFRSPSPPYYFRSTIGGNFASNYNWYGEQVIGASNAVAQGNGSPSRFPNSTIQWNINPGDTPIPDLATERDEFLFAFKGSPGYDVTVYGMYECIAKAFYLPAGWTDSVLDAVESKTLVTNGTTAAGNATLNFSGTGGNIGTNCFAGAFITDTTSAVIPLNTTVSSRTSTTVVMSANATGGGVGSGDTILCGSQWFFAGQLHADTEVAPGVNPPQAAFGWDIRAGHLWEHIWGGYASLGYSATNTNIDLGPYVKGQWTDVETCINFDAGTGVTGRSNGLVQVWTRTCDAGVAAPTPANCTAPMAKKQISANNTGSAIADSAVPTAWAQPDNSITPMYYKDGGYRNPQTFTQTYYSGPFTLAATFAGAALAAFGQYP